MLVAVTLFGVLLGLLVSAPGMWAAYGPLLAPVMVLLVVLFTLNMRLRETVPLEPGTRVWRINATLLAGMAVCGLVAVAIVFRI